MRSPRRSSSLKEMNSSLPAPRTRQRLRSVQIALSIIIAETIQAEPRSPDNKYVRDRSAKSPRGDEGAEFYSRWEHGQNVEVSGILRGKKSRSRKQLCYFCFLKFLMEVVAQKERKKKEILADVLNSQNRLLLSWPVGTLKVRPQM